MENLHVHWITLVDKRLTQEAQQRPPDGFKRLFSVHTNHHAGQRPVRFCRRKRCKQSRCCGNERLRGKLRNQNNVWRFMIHFNAAVYLAILLNFQAASNVYNCCVEPFTSIKWHTIRFCPSLFLQTDSSGSDCSEIENASAAGFIPIDPGMK